MNTHAPNTAVDLREERGFVLVAAVVLLAVMLTVGLAAFAFTDTGSKRAREQRERETSLNLAEGVLYAQGFALARNWPTPTQPMTSDCSSAVATSAFCADRDTLAAASSSNPSIANFSTIDASSNSTWSVKVRDNAGALASNYDPAVADGSLTDAVLGTCSGPCRYDFNGDKTVWVQASAVVQGRPRQIVAQMRIEELQEALPSNVVTAGGIDVSNNGNNTMINGTGSSVVVRCSPVTSSACVDYKPVQITPAPISAPATPPAMSAEQLARFKARAISDGRYYSGCPTKNASNKYDLGGAVVWVEDCLNSPIIANNIVTSTCTTPSGMSSKCVNTPTTPGVLIWHCGKMDFQGGFTYIGILYGVNGSDGTCPSSNPSLSSGCDGNSNVVITNGGFGVWGSLLIDGNGCLKVGSNGLQVAYNGAISGAAKSYGAVGLIQNTWRELKPT